MAICEVTRDMSEAMFGSRRRCPTLPRPWTASMMQFSAIPMLGYTREAKSCGGSKVAPAQADRAAPGWEEAERLTEAACQEGVLALEHLI